MRIWRRSGGPDSQKLLNEAVANSRAALEEARSARLATESLRAEVLAQLADDENHRGRAVRITLLTIALLGLSTWLILHGAAGLRDPSADGDGYGNVGVALETGGPPTDSLGLPFKDAPTFGVAGSFEPDENAAFYNVFFPPEFAGKKYALLLEDRAILRKITEGADQTPAVVPCKASGGTGETAYSISHRCQIIYGTVPSVPTTQDLIGSFIAPDSCSISELPKQFAMPHIQIWGTLETPIIDHLDWAHEEAALPGMGSGMSNAALNKWNGVPLDGWYGTGLQDGCKVSNIPLNAKITDANPSEYTMDHYALGWFGQDALLTSTIVARRRDADATANAFVAVGGILAGLAVGLVPVAYDAIRAMRRKRKLIP
jgi:hypothetical protein